MHAVRECKRCRGIRMIVAFQRPSHTKEIFCKQYFGLNEMESSFVTIRLCVHRAFYGAINKVWDVRSENGIIGQVGAPCVYDVDQTWMG